MDIVHYCIQHMSSKEHIHFLFNEFGIEHKMSDSYEKLVFRLLQSKNLKSGLLKGHNWHGAMPSMLHLSLQNKVRDHIDGKLGLKELISTGADIMKHEYFMVAVHDLCETTIIASNPSTIPPIGSKSISDFVFEGIPYDLKITNYFGGHTKEYVNKNKQNVVEQLLAGADVLRIREQAKKTINNWGLNRFYVLVEDQERWFSHPEGILDELIGEIKNMYKPMNTEIGGITISTQLIAI